MSARVVRTLGDIADAAHGSIRTGPFGSQLHRHDYTESPDGVPVVMPQNMAGGRVDPAGIAKVTPAKAAEMSGHVTRPGDVLLSRRGEIGRYCLVDSETAGVLCGTGSLRVSIQRSDLLPEYLCYFLETPTGLHQLEGKAVGATMPNINASIVRSLEVPVPPLEEQRKVVALLSAYGNLIENNRRRARVLEELARRIYHEWFVDLRYPGHAATPNRETEFGLIPNDWEWRRASEAMNVNPSVARNPTELRPFVPMASLSETGMAIEPIELRATGSGSRFANGDTLLARITPCLENGKTGYVQFLGEDDVASGSTEFIVLRSRLLCPELVYLLARGERLRSHARASMSGATGRQRVRESCFDSLMVHVPPRAVLERFAALAGPMFNMVHQLSRASDNAKQQRKLLLPRLIAGDIEVTNLDIAIP